MPLTGDQHEFVTTYILSRKFDDERRKERQEELDKLPKGNVSGDHQDLLDMLARTGRIEDTTAPGTRAEKKEAHLREIMLRDEDGLNINQIVDAIAPPLDKAIRDLAATEITDDMPPRQKADIQVARDKVEQYKSDAEDAQAQAEAELNQLIALEAAARGPGHDRDSLNAAMHALAERHGQHALSHHASRHGAHTTDDEQVRRVATGYAPDDAPPVGLGPVAANTQSGEAVTVPDVTRKGPHAVGAASRFASAEAAIQLVEGLLAEAHQARSRGETNEDTKLVQKTLNAPTDDVIGHSAKLTPKVGGNGYMNPATGADVPSANRLDKTPAQLLAQGTTKTDVIRDRAQAVTIERTVRGATVVLKAMPDGSFRTVTAYPDEDVAMASLRDDSTGMAVETDGDILRQRALATAQTALTAANQDITTREQELGQANQARDAAKQVAYNAISASIQALPADGPARDALVALQRATQAHVPVADQIEGHDQAEIDIKRALRSVDAEIQGRQNHVANLSVTEANMQALVTAIPTTPGLSNADKKQRNDDLRAAQKNVAEAQSKLDTAEDAKVALQAQLQANTDAMLETLAQETKLADAMQDAYDAAVAASDAGTADDVQEKARANSRAMTGFKLAQQAAKDAEVAVTQAKQVATRAQEAVDQNSTPGPSTDEAIAQERDARKDELQQALTTGGDAFAEKKQQWLDEIDAVEQMMADDAVDRARRVQDINAERELANTAQDAARKALIKATDALDAFGDDVSSAAFKAAVDLVDDLTRARDAAEATFKAIRGQYQDFKEQARMQDREDACNIELARARAEAVAIEAEVAQLTATGTPVPPEVTKRKAMADAIETMRKASLEFYQAVDTARQAKATVRVVQDQLDAATAARAKLNTVVPPATPEQINKAQAKVDALTQLLATSNDAVTDTEAQRDAAQLAMGASEKAVTALKKS